MRGHSVGLPHHLVRPGACLKHELGRVRNLVEEIDARRGDRAVLLVVVLGILDQQTLSSRVETNEA